VVSTLNYGSGRCEFKSYRGLELLTSKMSTSESTQFYMTTRCVYLMGGKASREWRWPVDHVPPSYAGPGNVSVLTLCGPTTVRLWESFILFSNYLLYFDARLVSVQVRPPSASGCPCASIQIWTRPATATRLDHKSPGVREVWIIVQVNRCFVLWSCNLNNGQSGDG